MDGYPTAPFSPPFYGQSMTFDDGLDVPLDDWALDDCGTFSQPGALFNTARPRSFLEEIVSRAPAEGHNVLSTDHYLGFISPLPGAGTPNSAITNQPVHTNQLIRVADHGIVAAELMSCEFGCEDEPSRPGSSSNHETLDAPSLNPSLINNFCAFSERNENLPFTSTLNATEQGQHGASADLFRLTDLQYLARLPHSVLKEISKAVEKALTIPKTETAQKSLEPEQDTQGQLLGGKRPQNNASGPRGIFKCEHPGCNTIFRRNKDRLRHVRQKHVKDARTLICPVVDCPMGFKHEFRRPDKLRDHLCGERISSYQWTCVIPGCSEVAVSRAGLIDHLGGHDFASRQSNYYLLADYGFCPRYKYPTGYFLATYICNVKGCPFGTDNEACMLRHQSIPHDGPYCACPIPDCQLVFEDWLSVAEHLARAHDYTTRERFSKAIKSQKHDPGTAKFMCPICHEMIEVGPYGARNHWQSHNPEQRLQGWKAVLNAWHFAFGRKAALYLNFSLPLRWVYTPTYDMVLAYLNLSTEELRALKTREDLNREGERLRTSFELRTNWPQS